MRYITW